MSKRFRVWFFPSLFFVAVPLVAEDDLRVLRGQAVRQAAKSVAASLVRVEKFGVAEAASEVADDAPTVAMAIDDKRHFIASSLVRRQTPASLVLVTEDGRRSTAKIIATDHKRQYVVLEAADDLGVKPVELTSAESQIGQTVVAVGRMAGDGSLAVSSGVLSAKDRLWGIALQTDARVSSVFYGGALIDLHGQLLGILVPAVPDDMGEDVTAWYDSGVAFAIPADAIGTRLPQLLKGDDVHAGLVGIVAKSNDPYVESTDIAAVRPRSPAARADIQAGDIVRSIAGVPVTSHREIKQVLGAKDAGQEVVIEFSRNDQPLTKTLTLAATIPPLEPQWVGITTNDSKSDATPPATLVTITGVFADSPAAKSLKVGDIVKSINESAISDSESLRRRIFSADPNEPLRLEISRSEAGEEPQTVNFSIQTAEISAQMPSSLPDTLAYQADGALRWTVSELTLPDIGNKATIAAPVIDEKQPVAAAVGLLLLLADPGESDLTKIANHWLEPARKAGVIVCVVAPAKDDRWHPEEIDSAGRIVASIVKRYQVNGLMTTVGGAGSGAGGSMAMAAAIGRPGVFSGLSVQSEVTPPAIRLRENDPSAPLQLLIRGDKSVDEPSWAAALEKSGFAVLRGDDKDETLLRWVRSLPRI